MNGRRIELIVAADEPALFFSSVERAERKLEVIDVEDGVYGPIFDRAGNSYSISVTAERVSIAREIGPPRPADLAALLRRFLSGCGHAPPPDETVDALLIRCEPYLGD